MNLTLSFLQISNAIYFNPFIFSFSNTNKKLSFNQISISNSFHEFFKSLNSEKLKISIDKSNFNNYLSSVLIFNQDVITEHRLFSFNPVQISNSFFNNVTNQGKAGGAILSFAPLSITNTLFLRCFSLSGGALALHNQILINFTTFRECSSEKSGGSIDFQSKMKVPIYANNTIFTLSSSKYFGTIYKETKGSTYLNDVNISYSKANQCVGALETSGGSFTCKYVIIDHSKCNIHNGCFVIRAKHKVLIDSCCFLYCEQNSFISDAAAALLFYDADHRSQIINTAFYKCRPCDHSFTVSVVSGTVSLIQCCFSGLQEAEINQYNLNVQNCSFSKKCVCSIYKEKQNITIGYMYHIQNYEEINEIPIHLFKSAGLSLLLSVLSAMVLTFIHKRLSTLFWRIRKSDRTII